jgi:aromatic ring-opening dioxygenase LigB subunit
MAVCAAMMVPHPPLIIPEVGRGREREIEATVGAFRRAAETAARLGPDTVVIISPHSVMYRDWFHISPGSGAWGDFSQFRAPQVRLEAAYDEAFVSELCSAAAARGFPAGTDGERDGRLDHGTLIPLYFLREACAGRLPFRSCG